MKEIVKNPKRNIPIPLTIVEKYSLNEQSPEFPK